MPYSLAFAISSEYGMYFCNRIRRRKNRNGWNKYLQNSTTKFIKINKQIAWIFYKRLFGNIAYTPSELDYESTAGWRNKLRNGTFK